MMKHVDIRTQYLQLQLKVTELGNDYLNLKAANKALAQQELQLQTQLTQSQEALSLAQEKIKELEKSVKISDKIAKIVVDKERIGIPHADLKEKLEEYIAIIDQSIETLRKL